MKTCTKCNKNLPLTNFIKRKDKRDGYGSWCIECNKEYRRKYRDAHQEEIRFLVQRWRLNNLEIIKKRGHENYIKNREKRIESNKKYAKTHRKQINTCVRKRERFLRQECLNHYGGKCNCCGEERFEFLSMDHINGGGNKHRKETNYRKLNHWLKQNNYPAEFRVLCHNCNHALGSYGYCPHKNDLTAGDVP